MIDAIFIATHRPHRLLTKFLCQSIRHFCGSLPIVILKDGTFELTQLKRHLNVQEFDDRQLPVRLRNLHGMHSKFKALFNAEYPRYLYLDADTILIGDPRKVPATDFDFYVEGSIEDVTEPKTRKRITKLIFDVDRVQEFDPDFDFSNFLTFNCGQYFASTGLVDPDLLFYCIKYSEHQNKTPIFKYGDQGIMNYIINKMRHSGAISVGSSKFVIFPSWEPEEWFPELTEQSIRERTYDQRVLIHFTGPTRKQDLQYTSYQWVPKIFRDEYYCSLPLGSKEIELASEHARYWGKRIGRKLNTLFKKTVAQQ